MARIIAGIIVGFIVMFILVIVTFGVSIAAMGGYEGILQPDSFWTTNTFNIIVLIGGTIGAIIGGLVCRVIAKSFSAAFGLAVLVLAMGIGSFVMNMNKPDPPARTGPVTMEDIQAHGKEPNWFALSKPLLGAVGVLIGSSLVGSRRPTV